MLYLSIYQLIKSHIKANTPQGKALLASRKLKSLTDDLAAADEFEEAEFSPVHYDMELVVKLVQ
jgi:hypothetical protein